MKYIKDIFIKRPMFWQYWFTIVLDLGIILGFEKNIPQKLFGFKIIYVIVSIIYYPTNYNNTKFEFKSLSEELQKDNNPTFWTYLLNVPIFFKYVLMGAFYPFILKNIFHVDGNSFIESIPLLVAVFLTLSHILFSLYRIPIIYWLSFVILPFFIFSVVGINRGALGWTFIALILSTLLPQYLNKDIGLLQGEHKSRILNNLFKDKDVERRMVRLKYKTVLFIPFLYLSLVFAEGIIYSDNFNYLYNILVGGGEKINSMTYFSGLNIVTILFKTLIVIMTFPIFIDFSDFVIDEVSNYILHKSLKIEPRIDLYGKFTKVYLSKRHWHIDNSNYYSCIKDVFQDNQNKVYKYKNNRMEPIKGSETKRFKVISNDIIMIDGDYYVKSQIIKKLSIDTRKWSGYDILNKPSYLSFLVMLLVLSSTTILYFYTEWSMETEARGKYVAAKVIKGDDIESVKESQVLIFRDDKVFYHGNEYKVDKVALRIQNKDNEIIGWYGLLDVLAIKNESGNIDYYVLKNSARYKEITNK